MKAAIFLTTSILPFVFINKAEAMHCGPFDFTGNCLHNDSRSNSSEIGPGLVYSDPLNGADKGYDHLPKAFIDADGEGGDDYCRFVGNAPNMFIACVLVRNGSFDKANQFSFRSISGVDQGYDSLPRGFRYVNGVAAYCRFVGDAPNIYEACNLTTSKLL